MGGSGSSFAKSDECLHFLEEQAQAPDPSGRSVGQWFLSFGRLIGDHSIMFDGADRSERSCFIFGEIPAATVIA